MRGSSYVEHITIAIGWSIIMSWRENLSLSSSRMKDISTRLHVLRGQSVPWSSMVGNLWKGIRSKRKCNSVRGLSS